VSILWHIVEETAANRARKDWLVSMLSSYRWEELSVEELEEIAALVEIE